MIINLNIFLNSGLAGVVSDNASTRFIEKYALNDFNKEYDTKHELRITFPIKGIQKDFTGRTKYTAPSIPGKICYC